MTLSRWSVSVVAVIGILAATLAGATIWLLLTDPVGGAEIVSQAISTGDAMPFVRALSSVLVDALRDLFKYL
jgi:hypothetical protein